MKYLLKRRPHSLLHGWARGYWVLYRMTRNALLLRGNYKRKEREPLMYLTGPVTRRTMQYQRLMHRLRLLLVRLN